MRRSVWDSLFPSIRLYQRPIRHPASPFPAIRLYQRPVRHPATRSEYELDEEHEYKYGRGGYHPVVIGDRLHERYRIVHKLGFGTYSMMWLARDERLSRYIAVKVGTARSDSTRNEDRILSRMADSAPAPGQDIRGRALIGPVLDRFTVTGPNGPHYCLVTTPERCSLWSTKDGSWHSPFQLPVARSLAAQLAIALAYVHDQGYVHGDVHLGNTLLRLPSTLDHLSAEQIYDQFGHPSGQKDGAEYDVRGHPQWPKAGWPRYTCYSAWFGKASAEIPLSEAKLVLADFGLSFRPAEEAKYKCYTCLPYRAPEAFFEPENPLSFPSDIWSLACTIWAILIEEPLFNEAYTKLCATEEDIAKNQVDFVGELPAEWWAKWKRPVFMKQADYDESWWAEAGQNPESWDDFFEEAVQKPRRDEGIEVIGDEERRALLEMLRAMMAFKPAHRPSAQEVLQTEWMRDWAIPEYEKTLK